MQGSPCCTFCIVKTHASSRARCDFFFCTHLAGLLQAFGRRRTHALPAGKHAAYTLPPSHNLDYYYRLWLILGAVLPTLTPYDCCCCRRRHALLQLPFHYLPHRLPSPTPTTPRYQYRHAFLAFHLPPLQNSYPRRLRFPHLSHRVFTGTCYSFVGSRYATPQYRALPLLIQWCHIVGFHLRFCACHTTWFLDILLVIYLFPLLWVTPASLRLDGRTTPWCLLFFARLRTARCVACAHCTTPLTHHHLPPYGTFLP